MNPIDIIANAIRVADGNHSMGAGQLAEVAATALTDDRIVDHVAEALYLAGWAPTAGEDAKAMARTALDSIGGPR